MNFISVFCGSNDAASEVFAEAAKSLAETMKEQGFGLIFGGARRGLMGKMALEFPSNQIIGVTMPDVTRLDVNFPNIPISEQANLEERKKFMFRRSQGFITIPGGEGTLDEFFWVNQQNKWNLINGQPAKPNCVLNIDGFFDGIEAQIKQCQDSGFIPNESAKHIYFSNKPQILLEHIKSYSQEVKKNQWWPEHELPEFHSLIQFSVFQSRPETSPREQLGEFARPSRSNRA